MKPPTVLSGLSQWKMSSQLFHFVFRWASYWAIWLIPQYTGPECAPSQAFGLSHLKLDPYNQSAKCDNNHNQDRHYFRQDDDAHNSHKQTLMWGFDRSKNKFECTGCRAVTTIHYTYHHLLEISLLPILPIQVGQRHI